MTFEKKFDDGLDGLIREAYRLGYLHGITAHAHMKDGITYVGTTGRSLALAKAQHESTWNYSPPTVDELRSGEAS